MRSTWRCTCPADGGGKSGITFNAQSEKFEKKLAPVQTSFISALGRQVKAILERSKSAPVIPDCLTLAAEDAKIRHELPRLALNRGQKVRPNAMPPAEPDPFLRLLRNARREACWILAIWAAFLVWVVGLSYARGYTEPLGEGSAAPELRSILGVPEWAFWGIAVPWAVATLVSLWFAVRVLADDELASPGDPAGEMEH